MTNPRDSRKRFRPGEVWSLWQMIELVLGDLVDANNSVTMMSQALLLLGDLGKNRRNVLGVSVFVQVREAALLIERVAKAVDLDSSEKAARRLVDFIDTLQARHERDHGQLSMPEVEVNELQTLITMLKQTFSDQAQSRFSIVLSKAERELYDASEPHFGVDVFDKFNDASRDIDEAAKCLALHRNTASVFHLMLAMERALRVLADKMGADLFNKKGQYEKWSVLVGRMKDRIPAQPVEEQDDWTHVHNLLWGVGRVWRNDTMHPAEAYTDEEARDVFASVKVFMRDLAKLV